MGNLTCSYDGSGQLSCPLAGNGASLQFEVKGNAMQGTMRLQDGTLWRKLTLKRVA